LAEEVKEGKDKCDGFGKWRLGLEGWVVNWGGNDAMKRKEICGWMCGLVDWTIIRDLNDY
jgi:hypothetical protein